MMHITMNTNRKYECVCVYVANLVGYKNMQSSKLELKKLTASPSRIVSMINFIQRLKFCSSIILLIYK